MNKLKILYIDGFSTGCNYYKDIIYVLSKYSILRHISKNIIHNIENFFPNVIIFGFSFCNLLCNNLDVNFYINLKKYNIPIYLILNKEYTGLDNKLNWIKKVKPRKVFTVHHDFKKYSRICNVPFYRIMWSANHKIFKKYNDIYKYDLYFSGVIREEQTGNLRHRIYNRIVNLNELDKYKLLLKVGIYKNGIMDGKNNPFNLEEYAININNSKIVLTTTGPTDIVGTRYFEIMASNKALILCNRMDKLIYEDIVIDKFNCIMFQDEFDFIEKCKYYLENENERIKIVNQAYKFFIEKHTWENKVKDLLNNL